PHMWLMNTHDAVLYLMGSGLKHLQLLPIDGLDDPISPLHRIGQWECAESIQLFFNGLEVPSQVLKLRLDTFSNHFPRGISILGHLQISFPGILPIRPR